MQTVNSSQRRLICNAAARELVAPKVLSLDYAQSMELKEARRKPFAESWPSSQLEQPAQPQDCIVHSS